MLFRSGAVEFALVDGLANVRTDPAQFQQVLLNLVLNARDAIDGTGRIDIVVRIDDASQGPLHERGVTVIPGAPPLWLAWSLRPTTWPIAVR